MEIQGDEVKVYDQLDELLIRVRAILKTLQRADGRRRSQGARPSSTSGSGSSSPDELADEIAAVDRRRRGEDGATSPSSTPSAESEIALLARYEPILGKIQPLAKQIVVHRRLRQRRAAGRAPLQGRPRAPADRARQAHELAVRDHLRPTSTRTRPRPSSSTRVSTPSRSTSSSRWRTSTRSVCRRTSRTCRWTSPTRPSASVAPSCRPSSTASAPSSTRCRASGTSS